MNEQLTNQQPTKVCSKCKEEKPVTNFTKHKGNRDGLDYWCKFCKKKSSKQSYIKNRERILLHQKKWRTENPEKIKILSKKYYSENKEEILFKSNQHRLSHKKERSAYDKKYVKNKLKTDPTFRITRILRNRTRNALKEQNVKKSLHTIELLGCTALEFQSYIASKFQAGMTLENNGERKWVLHHIKPCHTFNLSDPEQQRLCFHYTNIIPMWEDEHIEWHRNHPR